MDNLECTSVRCRDRVKLLAFLQKIDRQLPTPLSKVTNLEVYAEKVMESGTILAVEDKDKIVSAVLFYCNDLNTRKGYLTLLGTLPEYRGKGYAVHLFTDMEETAKAAGMTEMHLDADTVNESAITFYIDRGYKITECFPRVHMYKVL